MILNPEQNVHTTDGILYGTHHVKKSDGPTLISIIRLSWPFQMCYEGFKISLSERTDPDKSGSALNERRYT